MPITRRELLAASAATSIAAAAPLPSASSIKVDFRFSPLQWQTAFCFPDDPHKSLVDHNGRLLYGHPGKGPLDNFPTIVEFSLMGMERDHVLLQELEAPGVPIVHTLVERPEARFEIITFASNRAGEGRVDNVLMRVKGRTPSAGRTKSLVTIRTRRLVTRQGGEVFLDDAAKTQLLICSRDCWLQDCGNSWQLILPATPLPAEFLFRFPQAGQRVAIADGAELLEEARAYWKQRKPFGGDVQWELPSPYAEFLTACSRNILQAREVRNGRLTFQVGPTCYRGLWVVDGHFILEAARYLGYDAEARTGLQTTWTYQRPDGALDAGGGAEHYKDAAIAMFSTVRQCELSQDWTDFRAFTPQIRHAAEFLEAMRDKGRAEDSPSGKYGLLAIGFSDGGFMKGNEFTNQLWALSGLQAATQAAGGPAKNGLERASRFYSELRPAFEAAAAKEMVRHPAGFDFLPMVMREDPAWKKNEWERPQPQAAQWALSQAIYPGCIFPQNHAVVRGHNALMQWCTMEDVPVETGWIPHGGLWTYNAPFAAHAYLWAGQQDWARRTFHGFLNHASPLYCWREEQPLRGSTLAGYIGDMPHNWASAECVLYLRHMLALEDGSELRLLAGIGAPELAAGQPFVVRQTPTRFGRLNLRLAPLSGGWRLEFERVAGPAPLRLTIPSSLGGRKLARVTGAANKLGAANTVVEVEPGVERWSAVWRG